MAAEDGHHDRGGGNQRGAERAGAQRRKGGAAGMARRALAPAPFDGDVVFCLSTAELTPPSARYTIARVGDSRPRAWRERYAGVHAALRSVSAVLRIRGSHTCLQRDVYRRYNPPLKPGAPVAQLDEHQATQSGGQVQNLFGRASFPTARGTQA